MSLEKFKIEKVLIEGFWQKYIAKCDFNDEVNIIVGRNGTGKTTFMNILHAALAVDLEGLVENDFSKIEITLRCGKKKKTIKVSKHFEGQSPIQEIEYQISTKKYAARLIVTDDTRPPAMHYRKRAMEVLSAAKEELNNFVLLSSLSVYRMRNGEDYEIKDRSGRRIIPPIDFRLSQLMVELAQYQFDLSIEARSISNKLQKDVLTSILHNDSEQKRPSPKDSTFEKNKEMANLISAYTSLGVIDNEVKKSIVFHINAVDKALTLLNSPNKEGIRDRLKELSAVSAYYRTQSIIAMSLSAEEETKKIYSQKDLFIKILKSFIPEKSFTLERELIIRDEKDNIIPKEKLSSGEKQLLILLIEALLQRQKPFVYLTDEPELSLHIEWQRKIIPAITDLNRNSQIIVATHSPEIAGKYISKIINMKGIVNERA